MLELQRVQPVECSSHKVYPIESSRYMVLYPFHAPAAWKTLRIRHTLLRVLESHKVYPIQTPTYRVHPVECSSHTRYTRSSPRGTWYYTSSMLQLHGRVNVHGELLCRVLYKKGIPYPDLDKQGGKHPTESSSCRVYSLLPSPEGTGYTPLVRPQSAG